MIGWLGRLAARRVVWILVGLAVYAALNAVGVRASHIGDLVYTGTAFNLGGGYTGSAQNWAVTAGETYRLTVTGYGGGTENLALSYNGADCNLSCDAWHTGPVKDFVAPTGATTAYLAGRTNGGSSAIGSSFTVHRVTAEPTPSPTPTPTATPTPDPMCDPYCTVALSTEDRDRLDAVLAQGLDASEIVTYGFAILVMLGTATAVVTGLRR